MQGTWPTHVIMQWWKRISSLVTSISLVGSLDGSASGTICCSFARATRDSRSGRQRWKFFRTDWFELKVEDFSQVKIRFLGLSIHCDQGRLEVEPFLKDPRLSRRLSSLSAHHISIHKAWPVGVQPLQCRNDAGRLLQAWLRSCTLDASKQ